jgi:hypothetical protein
MKQTRKRDEGQGGKRDGTKAECQTFERANAWILELRLNERVTINTSTSHILTGYQERISTVLPSLHMKMQKQALLDSPEGDKRALSGEWKVPMTQPSACGHAHKCSHVLASPDATSKTERTVPVASTLWSPLKGAVLQVNGRLRAKRPRFPLRQGQKFCFLASSEDSL